MDQLLEYRLKLLTRLERQPSELADVVHAIPESKWHLEYPSDGRTPHQVAAHVRDLEALAFLPRFRRVLTEDNPILEPFPAHDWSAEQRQPAEPMVKILEAFARAREEALALMRGMSSDDWNRTGFHPPSGRRTALWWAERMYVHVHEHLSEIRQLIDMK